MRKIEVVPHSSLWSDAFAVEAAHVAAALGGNVIAIYHVGSTAIPGIYAKPIIDLLVEVKNITNVDRRSSAMESLGYCVKGEYGIPGRRYFSKDKSEGIRTHHVHAFEVGSTQIERHLAFRDYLIAHPEDAQRYSDLKRRLAQEHPHDIEAYMDGKDAFIKDVDHKAERWRRSDRNPTNKSTIC